MADIEKISVSGTSYDVRDANAAHALTDIAVAGDNIEFARDIQDNYSVQGTDVTVSSTGVASGFSASSYIYTSIAFWNSMYSNPFVFQTKFKITSLVSADFDNTIIEIRGNPYTSGSHLFTFNINKIGRLRLNETSVGTATVSIDTDYWLKAEYANGVYTISLSTDGSTFTQIGTITSTPSASTAERVVLGGTTKSSAVYLRGSIDLTETYFKDGNGNTLWAPVGLQSDKMIVNATVDQTYSPSSTNAQAGVAIRDAKFLRNTASGTSSLTVLGYGAPEQYSVNIGYFTQATAVNSTAIGTNAKASSAGSTAIGYGSQAAANYAIGIGPHSSGTGARGSYSVAIGQNALTEGQNAIALGAYGQATAGYAIQIGRGTNSTANTFSVGLSMSDNYRLLESNGTIPGERMALQGEGAPTTATVGSVGQFYVDTTNQVGYMCVSAESSTYVWKQITA